MFLAQFLKGKVTPAEVEDTVKELMSEISYVKNRELNYALYRPINLDKALFVDTAVTRNLSVRTIRLILMIC